ncbi:MAG: FAD-dependent oxidoreductase [Burkholderiaceae bacterium]
MTNCPRIEIIGLGLAGASMLHALAKARFEGSVQVFEQASGPAQLASGNPLGIVHPLTSADHNRSSQFFDDGLQVCMDWCQALGAEQHGWASFGGVIEHGDRRPGGWIEPVSFVQACLERARSWFGARLEIYFNTPAPPVTHGVRVVCSASPLALSDAGLCLIPVAGQVSWVQASAEEGPAMVLCGSGYVAPVVRGQLLVGASFERESLSTEVTQQGHAENFERLLQLDPTLAARMHARWPQAQGRAAVRWATRDRMPHIGQPVDRAALQAHPHPQRISQLAHLPRQAKTYVLMGLGSRGLSTAPLGATMIVHQMLGEPSPLPPELVDTVDPARFVLREHRRTGRWPEAHYSI